MDVKGTHGESVNSLEISKHEGKWIFVSPVVSQSAQRFKPTTDMTP